MSMFPIRLSFYLASPLSNIRVDVFQSILSQLDWGVEEDLLKHSDEWPEAVALVKERFGYDPEERCDFPVAIDFVRWPGRVQGNDGGMLPTKLALLRLLASVFECQVLSEAGAFCREENGIPSYAWSESFLCQGGRVFSARIDPAEAREGARSHEGWKPIDELPELSLNPDGSLVDGERSAARIGGWIEVRDQSHLGEYRTPIFPKSQAQSERPPPTPEEIEQEIAEEFPTDEELDREEEESENYFHRLEAWERGGGTTASKQLIGGGVSLPDPDSIDDEVLTEKLWEVIHGLDERNTYLHHTDHLSDRELYAWLWQEALNEDAMDLTGLSNCGNHTSPIGSGDEESKVISLTYYDSAEERADWHASWPMNPIPAHVSPPFDRDRYLPQREMLP